MDIRAAEISAILKDQIKNFGKEAEVSEVGQFSPSVTVSPASTVWTMFRPAKWWSSPAVSAAWR